MARRKQIPDPAPAPGLRRRALLLSAAFLLVQIVLLPGAFSPFRTPKTVLATTAIIIVVGLSAAGAFRRQHLRLRWSSLVAVLAVLPLLQAASAAWAGSSHMALNAALHSAIWVAGALWIAVAESEERWILVLGGATGAVVSGLVLVSQSAGLALLAVGTGGPTGRSVLTGLTGNPADLAMASALLLPLVLAIPSRSARPWVRWTLAILLTTAALVSQTLTALVSIGLVWLIWLVRRSSRKTWAGAAVVIVLLAAATLASGFRERVEKQFTRLDRGDVYFLLSARADGWTAAGEMIRSHPLTGVGAANFSHDYYPSRVAWIERTGVVGRRAELATHFKHAHCDPIQLVAELGIPGALWLLALVVVAFRQRDPADPVPLLFAAAFTPLALLHFPTHLAVSLVPTVLFLGHLLSSGRPIEATPGRVLRVLGTIVFVGLVLAGSYWQLQQLMLNLWRGGLTYAVETAQSLDTDNRARQAAAVEAQILPRITALTGARPWLWRLVGQARLAREDDVGAEAAFREAMALWPHEEAEFGLGLALAGQDRLLRLRGQALDSRNRRGEALVHLGRVCRTNPALIELIDDDELRRAVGEIVEADY